MADLSQFLNGGAGGGSLKPVFYSAVLTGTNFTITPAAGQAVMLYILVDTSTVALSINVDGVNIRSGDPAPLLLTEDSGTIGKPYSIFPLQFGFGEVININNGRPIDYSYILMENA